MPYLVDGNNVMFALAQAGVDAGRGRLTAMLEALAARENQAVAVVFDGAEKLTSPHDERLDVRVKVLYAAPRTADEVIEERIAGDTAPHRLTVVSSDHEIRNAAHRRRCRTMDSLAFAHHLLHPPARPAGDEPGRQGGLGPEETQRWLKEFGIADEEKP